MNDKDRIKSLVSQIDREQLNQERRDKLRVLIAKYGIENVALASGLSVSSILQYSSSKAQVISLEKLTQAESVLNAL